MSKLSEVKGKWKVDSNEIYSYTGEVDDDFPDALLIDQQIVLDGSISAEFTYDEEDLGGKFHTAGFVFRYKDPSNYYFAGIGGYDRKFVIGKRTSAGSFLLAAFGKGHEISKNKKYNLKIKFSGTKFELFLNSSEGQIKVLEAIDIPTKEASYAKGNIGLTVFGHSKVSIGSYNYNEVKSKWFVVTQFDDNWNLIEQTINSIIEGKDEFGPYNAELVSANKIFSNNPIISDIRNAIVSSSIILVDLSSISRRKKKIHGNANVFYELGMAHSVNPGNTILICENKRSTEKLPFDITHLRVIKYSLDKDNQIKELSIFKEALDKTIKNILEGSILPDFLS